MRITILAVGSRGDVQPYVALGLGLQEAGHEVRLVTADFFKAFIECRGLDFFPVNTFGLLEIGGEAHTTIATTLDRAGQLCQLWTNFRALLPALQQTQESVWRASQGTQAIIFSSIGTSAYHVAEKLEVPCVWALTVPMFGRTRMHPNPLLPALSLGRGYNLLTYTFVERFWQQLLGRLSNSWRRTRLDLPPIPLHQWPYTHLHGRPVPMLYCYSPAVAPRPSDWSEQAHVTGYWFLDHPSGWQPPADLVRFLESGPPPIYVGFSPTQIMTATRIITETVVDRKVNDVSLAVRIRRVESAETLVSPSNEAFRPSGNIVSSEYWLVFTDARVYRQDENLDLSQLTV